MALWKTSHARGDAAKEPKGPKQSYERPRAGEDEDGAAGKENHHGY